MVDFTGIEKNLAQHGINVGSKMYFKLQNAKETLFAAMKYFVGDSFVWINEYEKVAGWLADNKGRGLMLYGVNGNGKTVLIQKAIPAIFLKYYNIVISCYNSYNLNANASEALRKRFLSIDDFGTEEVGVSFGNKQWVLPDILDNAEKKGNIVLLSTNFTKEQILEKYGARTAERILSTTVRIEIKHPSFRN